MRNKLKDIPATAGFPPVTGKIDSEYVDFAKDRPLLSVEKGNKFGIGMNESL